MKHTSKYSRILWIIIFWLFCFKAKSQITNISGVINQYTSVIQFGTSTCIDTVFVSSTTGFSSGDTILIIQMAGASIDSSNSSAFGTINNINDAGNFEFCTIQAVGIGFFKLSKALQNNYNINGKVQVVSVPQYVDANVTGTLTCTAWNGTTGGVLAFMASGNIIMNSNIDVKGKGFAGGNASINYYTAWFSDYYCSIASGRGGKKGDGISSLGSNYTCARGAMANGGGGGNDINTGAGGGGNYGAGGHGGNNSVSSSFLWGEAGKSLQTHINSGKIFMGGGGGGGHQNNSAGTNGQFGGGIVIIKSNSLNGNGNSIIASGNDVAPIAGIDGAGGGGAGGSILLDVNTYSATFLTLNVKGGKGGDQVYIPQCHGNGGGGGGGIIGNTGTLPSNVVTVFTGGNKGIGQCNNTPHDAENGQAGATISIPAFYIPEIVIADAGPDQFICAGESVQIGSAPLPGLSYGWNNGAGNNSIANVSPAITTTYIVTVSNNGICPVNLTDSVTVTVEPTPVSNFNFQLNCDGTTVQFNNSSTNQNNCLWYFGDGDSSILVNPVHLYPDTGFYTVSLIVFNNSGCSDTSQIIIQTILPQFPSVNAQSVLDTCELTCFFTANANTSSVTWDFGDGTNSTLQNPNHTYQIPGNYNVSVIASNSCGTDTSFILVSIPNIPDPVTSFTYSIANCTGQVSFINTSQNSSSWEWNFGDGTTSTDENPIHNYNMPGSFQVTLISNGECFNDTLVVLVEVDSFYSAISDFTYEIDFCTNQLLTVNNSLYYDSLTWYFGDGTFTNLINPVHSYPDTGIYTVTLITFNHCENDTILTQVYVPATVIPIASFSYDVDYCKRQFYFHDNSTHAGSWNWNFGDGTFSTDQNPIHIFKRPGIFDVILTINEGKICDDDTILNIEIVNTGINGIYIPNSFTPNGDGKNDEFIITLPNECDSFKIAIYNRWGQIIYNSDKTTKGWDGKYLGSKAPEGVYSYFVNLGRESLAGTVVLIR